MKNMYLVLLIGPQEKNLPSSLDLSLALHGFIILDALLVVPFLGSAVKVHLGLISLVDDDYKVGYLI